jgi:lambda repressor-like predicted transcriptional regulator
VHAPLFTNGLARLAALTAELGKEGSNLNQLTHYVNAGRPVGTLANSIESSLQRIEELHRDAFELRTLFMEALGLEPPNHKGPNDGE